MSAPTIAVYGSARIAPDDPRYVAGIALGAALATAGLDRKSTRLNSSHMSESRMPSSA